MTADRCLELLKELRTLQLMARRIATFPCRKDTRAAWATVATAIDDRLALLGAVLVLDADAEVLQACELHLAREQPRVDADATEVIDRDPTTSETDPTTSSTVHPRITIH